MDMRVRVMHDYECFPLWVRRSQDEIHVNESAQDLGLSPSLAGRLAAWVHWGESRINMADPLDSRVIADEELTAFDAEGLLLAERVAEELPSAAVTYGPESLPT